MRWILLGIKYLLLILSIWMARGIKRIDEHLEG